MNKSALEIVNIFEELVLYCSSAPLLVKHQRILSIQHTTVLTK
jgi:hypothetical protein